MSSTSRARAYNTAKGPLIEQKGLSTSFWSPLLLLVGLRTPWRHALVFGAHALQQREHGDAEEACDGASPLEGLMP